MNNRGQIRLAEMAKAIRDITNVLYTSQKVPPPERIKTFAVSVMAEYNQEQEEDAYVLNVEQFVRSGLGSSQIANLFSLGAIPATEEDKSASSADEESNPSATSKKKAAPEPAQARAGASVPSEAQVPSSRGPKLAGEEVTKKRSNSASEHALVEKRAGTAADVEEEKETLEQMNARLVVHVRALQSELRKYMDFDKENKQELEQLKSQLKELTTENTHLKKKLHRASHESKLRKEKEKANEIENEMARQKDMEKEFVSVLQFLVGPPVEKKIATTLQDVRVIKCGQMIKRGNLIKSWNRRMFILRQNMQLIYYSVDDHPQPRGILDLRTVVVAQIAKEIAPTVLEINTNTRNWFLACDTEEEAQEWCRLINHLVETNKLRPAVGAEHYMPTHKN
jgi:hypothetical protein